ncbi:hypothetical protein [Pseudomonas phage PA1C]|nr:hypothetical protein [Pseudomonas phage PA1C]
MSNKDRLDEKKEWQESNPVLNEFCWAVSRTMGDVARTSDDRTPIVDIPAGKTYEITTNQENDIYNVGLETGMVNFVDHLRENGYKIISPVSGHPVPFEQAVTLVNSTEQVVQELPGKSFVETFYDYNWGVNT